MCQGRGDVIRQLFIVNDNNHVNSNRFYLWNHVASLCEKLPYYLKFIFRYNFKTPYERERTQTLYHYHMYVETI